MLHFIGFLITGFIIGLIARALKPGDDNMTLGKTALLGMVGSLIAGWIGRELGWYGPDQSAGFIVSTVGAIVVLSVYYAMVRSHPTRVGHL